MRICSKNILDEILCRRNACRRLGVTETDLWEILDECLNRIEDVLVAEFEEVKNALVGINPQAVYYNFSKGENADKILLKSIDKIEIVNTPDEAALLSSHKYKSVQTEEGLEFKNKVELQKFFVEQGPHLERAKGIVSVNQEPFLVNYTKSDFSLLACAKSFDYGISMIFSED